MQRRTLLKSLTALVFSPILLFKKHDSLDVSCEKCAFRYQRVRFETFESIEFVGLGPIAVNRCRPIIEGSNDLIDWQQIHDHSQWRIISAEC
jgi:hypothetical protein